MKTTMQYSVSFLHNKVESLDETQQPMPFISPSISPLRITDIFIIIIIIIILSRPHITVCGLMHFGVLHLPSLSKGTSYISWLHMDY